MCCPDEPGQEEPGCVISVKRNRMHIAIDQLICVAGNRGLTPLGLSKDDLLRRACVQYKLMTASCYFACSCEWTHASFYTQTYCDIVSVALCHCQFQLR